MLYQTQSIYKDGSPVTCKIVDNSKNPWIVEYYDSGTFVKVEVDPSDIISLDYCTSDLSQ
jgi:hypothetical protein